jgi:hypothetical protein
MPMPVKTSSLNIEESYLVLTDRRIKAAVHRITFVLTNKQKKHIRSCINKTNPMITGTFKATFACLQSPDR